MSSCQDIEQYFTGALAGELEPVEEQQLNEHLRICAACQHEYERFEASWELLGAQPQVDPPVEIVERLFARIEPEARGQKAPTHPHGTQSVQHRGKLVLLSEAAPPVSRRPADVRFWRALGVSVALHAAFAMLVLLFPPEFSSPRTTIEHLGCCMEPTTVSVRQVSACSSARSLASALADLERRQVDKPELDLLEDFYRKNVRTHRQQPDDGERQVVARPKDAARTRPKRNSRDSQHLAKAMFGDAVKQLLKDDASASDSLRGGGSGDLPLVGDGLPIELRRRVTPPVAAPDTTPLPETPISQPPVRFRPPPRSVVRKLGGPTLDHTVIMRVVSKRLAEIRYCYEKELQRLRRLSGRVEVRFTVQPDGLVSSVSVQSSTLNNVVVETCVVQRIRKWVFPALRGGAPVEAVYPFVFHPRKTSP